MNNINDLKEKIYQIKEYLNTEICQKCKEMSELLKQCEDLVDEYNRSDKTS